MQTIKGVIFDLDGTIANTLPLCIRAFRQSVEPLLNRTVSDSEIIATFGPSEEGTIQSLVPGQYEKGMSDYLLFYESLHGMCPSMFDGIEPLLAQLQNKGLKIAMVTGKGKFSTAISLKQFNASHFFEIVETGSKEGPRKKAGILAVIDQWKEIDKSQVIYVGDAPGDITASREAGIPVVAAAWADTAEPQKLQGMQPDQLFYSVKDFSDWLYTKL